MKLVFSKLGDVAEFINGAAFKPDDWGDVGKKIIRIQNLTDKSKPFNRTNRQVGEQFHVQLGDLLVSWSATLGVFEWEDPEVGLLNQHIFRVRPDSSKVDKRYLRHALELALLDMRKHLHGATMLHVNRGEFLSTKLYLPPLPEQIRIAAILDKADALRVKRREALAQLDSLTQAIFIDMFGDPVTNPKGIKREPLGNLIKLKSGNFLPATEMVEGGSYPVFGGNGINGYHDQFMFSEPQIIIGRVGVYCGCVHVSPPTSWVTDNALYVSESAPQLNFGYLAYSLKQAKLNQYASQSAQPLISGARLYPIKILAPPLELQTKFTKKAAAVEKLRDKHSNSLTELDNLFASLQHRAFRGEL